MNVAMIGGGPAGSMAAERLAREGFAVTVFEEKRGWEKPCGGGLPARALDRYPFLLNSPFRPRLVHEAELIAPGGALCRTVLGGASKSVRLPAPLAIFDRASLNGMLLERAERAGAEVIADRIVGLGESAEGWRLAGRSRSYRADFVVLAAGARSRLRGVLAADLPAHDFMLTFGYLVPGIDDRIRVQFYEDFEGYFWTFPRSDRISVGICRKASEGSMPELKARLHKSMSEFGLSASGGATFAHLLPALSFASWTEMKLGGPNWALAGDSAGMVDAVTGEGIYYAMRSGELIAECLAAGSPSHYPRRVWEDFGRDLAQGARFSHMLYHGDVFGRPVSSRMIELSDHNKTLGAVVADLLSGRLSYLSLASRLYLGFAASLARLAVGSLASAS